MKINKLFAFMAAASLAMGFSASCTKDNSGSEEPEKLSSEAKLLKFDVTGNGAAGDVTIAGSLFEKDKVVELPYLPDDLVALAAATKVEYEISEKATIAPDPATVKDFSVEGG